MKELFSSFSFVSIITIFFLAVLTFTAIALVVALYAEKEVSHLTQDLIIDLDLEVEEVRDKNNI